MSKNKKTVVFIEVMEGNNTSGTQSSDISSIIKESFDSESSCLNDDSQEEKKNAYSNSTTVFPNLEVYPGAPEHYNYFTHSIN